MEKVSANTTQSAPLVRASARYLHIAPRKVRLVTNLLRGMPVNDALVQLQHLDKKASEMLSKLLRSAVANAKNNFSLESDKLYIKSITTDMGVVMKRYFPRARGSAFPIRHKTSHVNVVLEERKALKGSKSKFALFSKQTEAAVQNVDQKEETNIKPASDAPKKPQIFRSDEQIKMSKAQNKRRLFNRKSGE